MLGQSGISPTDIAEDPDSMVGVFKAMQFAAGVNDQHLAVHGKVLPGASVKGYVVAQSCLLIQANYLKSGPPRKPVVNPFMPTQPPPLGAPPLPPREDDGSAPYEEENRPLPPLPIPGSTAPPPIRGSSSPQPIRPPTLGAPPPISVPMGRGTSFRSPRNGSLTPPAGSPLNSPSGSPVPPQFTGGRSMSVRGPSPSLTRPAHLTTASNLSASGGARSAPNIRGSEVNQPPPPQPLGRPATNGSRGPLPNPQQAQQGNRTLPTPGGSVTRPPSPRGNQPVGRPAVSPTVPRPAEHTNGHTMPVPQQPSTRPAPPSAVPTRPTGPRPSPPPAQTGRPAPPTN